MQGELKVYISRIMDIRLKITVINIPKFKMLT